MRVVPKISIPIPIHTEQYGSTPLIRLPSHGESDGDTEDERQENMRDKKRTQTQGRRSERRKGALSWKLIHGVEDY